jgi:hypothetical protein
MAAAPTKAETLPKAVTGTQAIQLQTLMPMLKVDTITLTIQGFPVGMLEIMATLIPTPPCRRLIARRKAHAHHRPHQTFWAT